jgi:thioredoxin 1
MADPIDVTDQDFESEVLNSKEPVVVDFWAEWCAPCKAISPIMKDLAGEYEGRVKVMKVNVDDCHQTSAKFNIRSIPTVLAFQNGQVVEQLQGGRPKNDFKEMIDKLL